MFDSRDVWATGEGEDSAHTKSLCEHDAKSSCYCCILFINDFS